MTTESVVPKKLSVLVTGGTGTFGRAFIQAMLADESVGRICVYSRDEHKQAALRQVFHNDERLRFFIGDVRDKERLRRAFDGVQWVIHAAALKRIEVGHYNPVEMVKTNVSGTVNVVEAAMDAGVQRVVYLSTDKAFQPVSPYGASKQMAESIVLAANNTRGIDGPSFAVTRYGNVAGSTGSVIPTWRKLVRDGAIAVPVTDPECTRFWMTISEAVALVLGALKDTAQQLVVPKLPAYRLGDLASAMGVDSDITGLKPWEKKHESMSAGNASNRARRMGVDELREALKHV